MTTSIFHRNWLRVVFEGRNQAYGAFVLRLREERRLAIAMLLTVTITMGGLLLPSLIGKVDLPSLPGPVTGDLDPFTPTTKTRVQVRQTGYPQPTKSAIPIIVQKLQEIDTTHVDDTLEAGPGPIGPVLPGGSPGTTGGNPNDKPGETKVELEKRKVWDFVEVKPTYPGGDPALIRDLQSLIDVTPEMLAHERGGIVHVRFVVDERGYVVEPEILSSFGLGSEEVVRKAVVRLKRWYPGRQNGVAVAVHFTMPVVFELE